MSKASVVRDKDGQLRIKMPGGDRSEYYKEYYQQHKKDYEKSRQSQIIFVRYVEVKKAIMSLKKQIGTNNYDLIMAEIKKLKNKKI